MNPSDPILFLTFSGELKVASLFNNLTSIRTALQEQDVDLTLVEFIQLINASVDFQKVVVYSSKCIAVVC